jgi:putative methionine-R-sulfoxide reductase with GAF domain
MLLESYCERSGLVASGDAIRAHRTALQALLTPEALASAPVQWSFRVPELGDAGACSLFGQLADAPYDLARTLGGRSASNQRLLAIATVVVEYYRQHSRSQWFGIYQARRNPAGAHVLVKLAYFGAESRAEFPLTEEFAKGSNNSAVGLSGRARLINDVATYVAEGGGYYTCDPKVKAEACLPLFDAGGQVVGILDAEAFDPDFFAGDELALVTAVALTLCGDTLQAATP